jgi:ribonuclease D
MKSHQEAHDSADGSSLPDILDHDLVPANTPDIVTDDDGLEALLSELRNAGSFGYDTEFIGEHTYYPHYCLIQVATSTSVTLIDPLASIDLLPFWRLLADDRVEKIVHAGMQDLEPVLRLTEKPPANIVDVQIASAMMGVQYPISLIKLVAELTGADLGHGAKFSQWDHRPLSPVQKQYAANDVRYLPLVRTCIGKTLDELGNADWAAEESATLANPSTYQFDPSAQRLRIRGAAAMGPRRRAILRAMLMWRDSTARHVNLPPRAFIKDEVLYDLVKAGVSSPDDLEGIRGLPRPVKQHYAQHIVETIKHARNAPVERVDRKQRYAARDLVIDKTKVNAMWDVVVDAASARQIHPAIVTSKKELTRYLYAEELGHDRAAMRISQGWRAELLAGALPK